METNNYEENYRTFVSLVIEHGELRRSRAGDTYQMFGTVFSIKCMPDNQFPILTGRQMFLKPILGELAAFLRGATKLKTFKDYGCNYWDQNAKAWKRNEGLLLDQYEVGLVYGYQWRNWEDYEDQLGNVVRQLRSDPFSRRHVVTAWNPGDLNHMCLPPCHMFMQFGVDANEESLDLIVYMRSVDLCLGLPSDIALYSVLLILVANQVNMKPGMLTFMMADSHVYTNHFDLWEKYKETPILAPPSWSIDESATIDNFEPDQFKLLEYFHGPSIQFPLNV